MQAEVSDPRNHNYNRSHGLVAREIHPELTWPTFPTIAEHDTFLVVWIALLESRALILGGEPTSDFICGYRKNPTPSDINALHEFLENWPSVQQVDAGVMIDAWYDDPINELL